ncbi:MAG: excinuclease ABC subunit UvrC [Chloroherpetonaceae bacterium]|nr:excinuclease ABC subunit UvrC [Chthonomonadaceae bacterium]MDW8207444.1 excinuclease ABC subunit UvrC [Chloroherpetonaceae bacterium]
MPMIPPTVQEKLATLPGKPGVYLHKDASGTVIYVGKAVNLRQRVRSYFQKSANLSPKVRRLVAQIADLEYVVCESELEALVLECSLIKKYQPHFNVRLRDDKHYPYLCLTTSEPFPRLMLVRRVRDDRNRYFGPYTSSRAVYQTMEVVNRVFPLIACGKSFDGRPVQKPCLYYHMGQCLAPCAGLANREEYRAAVRDVIDFLEGRQEELIRKMRQQMEEAAEQLEFERAARIRDRLRSVEEVLQRQRVISTQIIDQDVIAMVPDDTGLNGACVQMFYIRGGKLIGQNHYLVEGTDEQTEAEIIREFVKQYYQSASYIPQEILLPHEMDEIEVVQAWLRQRKGRKVEIRVPRRGERKDLIEMAMENARHALEQIKAQMRAQLSSTERALQELAEALGLEAPPRRIECFDISNTQGQNQVASMVVCENGQMNKKEYRKFRIRCNEGKPDDYAAMQEVITRRLQEARAGNPKFHRLPDLLIVDGGRGQVSAAVTAMLQVGMPVPVAGLAKQFEYLFRPEAPEPIILPRNSQALFLLQRIRDEAHRFSNAYQARVRARRATHSLLEEIPGIGPKRRKQLQIHFGGLARMREATVEELAAVPGMNRRLAETVYDYLHAAGEISSSP